VERRDHLDGLLERDAASVIDAMLERRCQHRLRRRLRDASTAVYRADAGTVEYRWPGASWHQSLADFRTFDGHRRRHTGMTRRQVLEEVAAGRLAPAEAARLLDTAGGARSVRLVRLPGRRRRRRPGVASWSSRTDPPVRREGDVLVVGDPASRFGRGAREGWRCA
jgi:hypothetical protein